MEPELVVDGTAWRTFCERLARMGDEILGPDYPGGERARAEGYRHLANQTSAWLEWAIGYPVEQPAFFRQTNSATRSVTQALHSSGGPSACTLTGLMSHWSLQ